MRDLNYLQMKDLVEINEAVTENEWPALFNTVNATGD